MNNFVKGMAAGLVVGAAATATLMPKSCKKRAMKSSAGKAIKAVGSYAESQIWREIPVTGVVARAVART